MWQEAIEKFGENTLICSFLLVCFKNITLVSQLRMISIGGSHNVLGLKEGGHYGSDKKHLGLVSILSIGPIKISRGLLMGCLEPNDPKVLSPCYHFKRP